MNKFIRGFGFAFKGLGHAVKTQLNFRVHLVLMVIAIALSWYLQLSSSEWLWIIFSIGLVLLTELVNTAIELLVDLVSPGFNETAGKVKDIAAAAVLVTAFTALAIGIIIFLPKLLQLFSHAA